MPPHCAVPIVSSLLTRTTYPTFAIRFVSHSALIKSHSGGGGTVPYAPEIMVDIISHLIATTDPGKFSTSMGLCLNNT